MSGISIKIPDDNVEERTYAINTLFECFLHLEISETAACESENTEISFGNGKIVIEDHFWKHHKKTLSYLDSSCLPAPRYIRNDFCPESDLPVIYGNGDIIITSDTITCGADIFASAFFMLARWEEHCPTRRDRHGRFSATESVALKYGFLHRPVVNEYAEMLWNMMKFLGFDGDRPETSFQPVLTHDVDILESNSRIKSAAGDILFRHNLKMAKSRFATRKDPADTFGFLMDQSEKNGLKSTFFLMASDYREGKTGNYLGTRRFNKLIEEITARGHGIGFHAGFGTSENRTACEKELEMLRKATGCDVCLARQHYLKIQIPQTLQILQSCGISTDCTLGYHDHEGFRCGTGNRFPTFDFLNRRTLDIHELPLVIMDGTLKDSRKLSPDASQEIIAGYFDLGRKYRMPVSILFHNSSFDGYLWKGWKEIYTNVTDNLSQ